MAALRMTVRILVTCAGVVLLATGGMALGLAYWPDHPAPQLALGIVFKGAALLVKLGLASPDAPLRLEEALASALLRFGLVPLGFVVLVAALLPGNDGDSISAGSEEPGQDAPVADPRLLKKLRKEAALAAKQGNLAEAAELCISSGLLDEAARYFIDAGDVSRAAEIRHDQNRFIEAAELHLKAGAFVAAGSIFGQQEEYGRAAEAYLQGGNHSVAAEMFEKAGDDRRAADCYAESGFTRHAAEAYVRCSAWKSAAVCLEEVITSESHGAGMDAAKHEELQKLVLMAGKLYERAQLFAEARGVLERGGCLKAAAEMAQRCGDDEKASELFMKAGETARAAESLSRQGDGEGAARVLAEYHRDRGEEEEAARHFEEAGEHLAAGDLYRAMERYDSAADCYERAGEYGQAAELLVVADQRERAGQLYERAGKFAEAAECYALAGNSEREAELLAQAGEHFKAGQLYHQDGRHDEAIKALQEVAPDSAEFAAASVLLGGIFKQRGMLSLAVKKLRDATEQRELSRENIQAFYELSTAHEEVGDARAAVEILEKILAFDFHYADVAQRLSALRETIPEPAAADAASPSPTGGDKSGRYKIIGKLGRGGMGIVYKAQDSVLDRIVALKVLPDALKENPQALANFLREAKSAAQLNHPNIVTVYDTGEQSGVCYIAMEYVDGSTLKEVVKRRGKIPPAGVVHVLLQLCEALAYAHGKKIVHRDIKTANTMWTRDRQAKIMDFGLAKIVEEVRNHTTAIAGTPYYMSPEQTLGKSVDYRTDIYSLGVSIFELATGTLPFREGNLPYHHVHTPAPDPRELNDELPELLARII
ncbi:MAG: protein kinase, partial [Myxococcota bacterium]